MIMPTGHYENWWYATEKCYTCYTPGSADTEMTASLSTNLTDLIKIAFQVLDELFTRIYL